MVTPLQCCPANTRRGVLVTRVVKKSIACSVHVLVAECYSYVEMIMVPVQSCEDVSVDCECGERV